MQESSTIRRLWTRLALLAVDESGMSTVEYAMIELYTRNA
jgi:hypothetical protein